MPSFELAVHLGLLAFRTGIHIALPFREIKV